MATVILLRHGRSTANAGGVLAGRTVGVNLDEEGRRQAGFAAERLARVPLAARVCSPLERCRETVEPVTGPDLVVEEGLNECDYGDWAGGTLADLAKEDLWRLVQRQPSAVAFPGGESLAAMQARAVEAVRRHDRAVEAAHGPRAVWLAVSHGDIIKSVLADALGLHLDLFQRIHVDPASMSVIHYTDARPYVLTQNSRDGDLQWVVPPQPPPAEGLGDPTEDDVADPGAPVGGGAGPAGPAA